MCKVRTILLSLFFLVSSSVSVAMVPGLQIALAAAGHVGVERGVCRVGTRLSNILVIHNPEQEPALEEREETRESGLRQWYLGALHLGLMCLNHRAVLQFREHEDEDQTKNPLWWVCGAGLKGAAFYLHLVGDQQSSRAANTRSGGLSAERLLRPGPSPRGSMRTWRISEMNARTNSVFTHLFGFVLDLAGSALLS